LKKKENFKKSEKVQEDFPFFLATFCYSNSKVISPFSRMGRVVQQDRLLKPAVSVMPFLRDTPLQYIQYFIYNHHLFSCNSYQIHCFNLIDSFNK